LVKGATVKAEIIHQGRIRSITIFKKQRRKNYRRTNGHRQGFTKLRITGIETA
jgi:large subunit ribosomal protein L21